tara:strand:+ start:2254 stop:2448 length:195 start_codon:yes stop_codon:yes gene_type:complete
MNGQYHWVVTRAPVWKTTLDWTGPAAPSNAALVKRTVEVCEKYERPAATYMQAREILGLRPFTS